MTRKARGAQAYHFGLAAEESVLRYYEAQGFCLFARRWRQTGAEIDLILQDKTGFVCVEVKAGSSQVSAGQKLRLLAAAEAFFLLHGREKEGRFDVAFVSPAGQVSIFENALFS